MFLQVVGRDRLTVLAQVRGRRIQTVGDLGQTTGCELSIVGQIPKRSAISNPSANKSRAARRVEFQGKRPDARPRTRPACPAETARRLRLASNTQTTVGCTCRCALKAVTESTSSATRRACSSKLQAELGEGRTPRGTHHQSFPEQLLQLRDATRDGRFGQTEAFGRAAETAPSATRAKISRSLGFNCSMDGTMLSVLTTSGDNETTIKYAHR